MKERRKFHRFNTGIIIEARELREFEQRESAGVKLVNISEGGCYVELPFLKVLSLVELKVPLPNRGKTLSVKGIVQFNDGEGVGIKFIDVEEPYGELLKSLLDDEGNAFSSEVA